MRLVWQIRVSPIKILRILNAGWIAGLLFVLSGAAARAEFTLFAAASLTDVTGALLDDFAAKNPSSSPRLVTGASSTLARQIVSGAPADAFISANRDWAKFVAEGADFGVPEVVFGNRMVVVSTKDQALRDLKALADALDGGRLALGDPAHVPAGIYAQQALESAGVWKQLQNRLAPAADVRGVLAYVVRGAAPFGIVYQTDALAAGASVALEIDPALHDPVAYYMVFREPPTIEAISFALYLGSEAADEIIARFGFLAWDSVR